MVLVPTARLEGRRDLPPTCSRRKNSFVVKISQVALSGPDWRVWREDLAPVMVSITAAAVARTGSFWLWIVCLVVYQCGGEAGTLVIVRGFNPGSDGVHTLGRN